MPIRLDTEAYNVGREGPRELVGDSGRPIQSEGPVRREPRWRMSLMMMLGVIWAVITTALVIVLIYRSTLSMHEDDQLFIDESTANLRAEQEALLKRMNKITPIVRILARIVGVAHPVIAGMWFYAKINSSGFQ